MKKILASLIILILSGCEDGSAPPPPPRVKRVITIKPIETRYMENSDASQYGLGENLYNHLVTVLHNSGSYVVITDESSIFATSANESRDAQDNNQDRFHFDFSPYSSADFNANIDGLSFQHGSRGLKNWSGFSRDFKTDWNNGTLASKNEFTPRSLEFARSWFGNTFDPIGSEANNTISGVDAGEQGEFNLFVAGVYYRRDSFLANAQVSTKLTLTNENKSIQNDFESFGKGFLFALGGSYQEMNVEFGIKINYARKLVFDRAIDKMSEILKTELVKIPFRTKVEIINNEGTFINAGRREGLIVGDQFVKGDAKFEVSEVYQIGALIKQTTGKQSLAVNDVIELIENSAPPKGKNDSIASNSSSALSVNSAGSIASHQIIIDPPELLAPADGSGQYQELKTQFLLPYYLTRYTQTDQEISTSAPSPDNADASTNAKNSWNLQKIDLISAWKKISSRGDNVKVAVIDSGVDYNHKNLYYSFDRNQIGWDLFSNEPKAFDDNSHGTAIAGIIASQASKSGTVGIAPKAKILSYRVFDPYGQTRSAAIVEAAKRAVRDGAKILVLAWDTGLRTQSLESIVRLAEANNVLIVTASGDQGRDLRDNMRFPAYYSNSPNVITVASLAKTQGLTKVSGRFSNWGDGIVDIAAPGEDILTLSPRSGFLPRNGSDLGAAHVAGVAALALGAFPKLRASEIKALLLQRADFDASLNGLVTGSKRLNANIF